MTARQWLGIAFSLLVLATILVLVTWLAWQAVGPMVLPSEPKVAVTEPTTGPVLTWPAEAPRELVLELGNGIAMKLALIPAGQFQMGSGETEEDRVKDEGPQRTITITHAFYLGTCEVTQEQYQQVTGKNPSFFAGPQGKGSPVEQVSWEDAAAFCASLSRKTGKTVRLPTEAEWEHACRAGTTTRLFYGNDQKYDLLGQYAWAGRFTARTTNPVGGRKPSPWGLCDVYGNVGEWCSDWYAKTYEGAATEDPQGPPEPKDDKDKQRVVRGGSWSDSAWSCRSASRNRLNPADKAANVGLRVVVELPQ